MLVFRYEGDRGDDAAVDAFLLDTITWCVAHRGTADLSDDDAAAVAAGLDPADGIRLFRVLMAYGAIHFHRGGGISIHVLGDGKEGN